MVTMVVSVIKRTGISLKVTSTINSGMYSLSFTTTLVNGVEIHL